MGTQIQIEKGTGVNVRGKCVGQKGTRVNEKRTRANVKGTIVDDKGTCNNGRHIIHQCEVIRKAIRRRMDFRMAFRMRCVDDYREGDNVLFSLFHWQ